MSGRFFAIYDDWTPQIHCDVSREKEKYLFAQIQYLIYIMYTAASECTPEDIPTATSINVYLARASCPAIHLFALLIFQICSYHIHEGSLITPLTKQLSGLTYCITGR